MPAFIKRLHWIDWLILAVLAGVTSFVAWRIGGALKYEWRWELIPDYILRYREDRGEWFANVLLQGLFATLRISLYASLLALGLGMVLGLARVSKNLTIRLLARTYLELLRNIPPVVIIFIFFFFLSQQLIDLLDLNAWSRGVARGIERGETSGIWTVFFGDMRRFPSLVSGVLVLAMFEAAFVGEIIRAGIQSIPNGQREAARAIGMSGFQEMRYIILPQAVRKVMPPMASQFINLIKDSSIISLISVQELTYKTVELVASTRLIFEAWITTAAFYFILCFGLSMLFRRLEK